MSSSEPVTLKFLKAFVILKACRWSTKHLCHKLHLAFLAEESIMLLLL